jgi:hypothetical protein
MTPHPCLAIFVVHRGRSSTPVAHVRFIGRNCCAGPSGALPYLCVVAGLVEADRGTDAAHESMDGRRALSRGSSSRSGSLTLERWGYDALFMGLLGTFIGIVAAFDELACQHIYRQVNPSIRILTNLGYNHEERPGSPIESCGWGHPKLRAL